MLQAIATLASLAAVAVALKVMVSSVLAELPALHALVGPRELPQLAVLPVRVRMLPARRATMVRIAPPQPGRAAA